MILKLRYKIWIEKEGKKVFGDGPLDILHRVERAGSLRQAAEEINMSYSQAWNLIKDLEERLGFKLLERKIGGESGGGSQLTEPAKKLMMKFEIFRHKAQESLNLLYKEIFRINTF
jgi:molybdate transport system regulatory protein